MTDHELDALARRVGEALANRGCGWPPRNPTGGWIAEAVTAIAGSSGWFDRGFVTYSNDAKTDMLGVRAATLETHGAVSEATVGEMAAGALDRSRADLAVADPGSRGPGGGSPAKPVGTVCLAWARDGPTGVVTVHLDGDRAAVRRQTVILALRAYSNAASEGRRAHGAGKSEPPPRHLPPDGSPAREIRMTCLL